MLRPRACPWRAWPALLLAACGHHDPSGPAPALRAAADARPVIMISIDSLRADHCTPYGYQPQFAPGEKTTPFLERAAAEGARFAAASAPTSWTLPSHMSLLTGMSCNEHGVRNRDFRLEEGTETIASRFHAAGYATAGFFSAPFLHPAWGFGHGFDHYEGAAPYLQGLEAVQAIADTGPGTLKPLHDASHEDHQCSERVVDAALRWLEEGQRYQRPFFLFLHLWDPHYDYVPPADYAARFHPGYTGGVDGRNFIDPQRRYAPEEMDHIRALYDAEIRYTDDQIARLWERLEQWGLGKTAILSISSDHGDEFYEHGQKGHQKTLYEEVLHVPMVVRAPGLVAAGTVVDGSVALYDLAPTLLDLAGVPAWTDRSGKSLRPLLADPRQPGHAVLLDLDMNDSLRLWGWREQDDKALWSPNRSQGEIYDLRADPGEQRPARLQSLPQNEVGRRAWEAIQSAQRLPGHTRSMDEPEAMTSLLDELGYTEHK